MSKTSNIVLASGAILLVAGASVAGVYLYQQWLLTDYLCSGTKGIKFNHIGADSTTVEINIAIENKGSLDIELKKMVMKVYANGIPIADINQNVLSSIKPFQTTTIPILITFNPKDVLGNIFNILSQTAFKEMSFRFDGKAVVKKFGIPISIPFDFSYSVKEMMAPSGTSICENKENKK